MAKRKSIGSTLATAALIGWAGLLGLAGAAKMYKTLHKALKKREIAKIKTSLGRLALPTAAFAGGAATGAVMAGHKDIATKNADTRRVR